MHMTFVCNFIVSNSKLLGVNTDKDVVGVRHKKVLFVEGVQQLCEGDAVWH